MSYSVVIPAYNEAGSIGRVLAAVKEAAPEAEIIVVDDGSSDGTAAAVKGIAGVKLVCHGGNRGAVAAVVTGARAAANEVIVTLDADGQHPAALVPVAAALVLRGEADVVLGVRPSLPRLGERLIARAAGVSDATTGFRAFRRDAAVLLAGDYAYGGVFVARARRAGLRIREYPIPVYPRAGGRTFHSRCRVFWVAIRFLLAGRGGCAGGGV